MVSDTTPTVHQDIRIRSEGYFFPNKMIAEKDNNSILAYYICAMDVILILRSSFLFRNNIVDGSQAIAFFCDVQSKSRIVLKCKHS